METIQFKCRPKIFNAFITIRQSRNRIRYSNRVDRPLASMFFTLEINSCIVSGKFHTRESCFYCENILLLIGHHQVLSVWLFNEIMDTLISAQTSIFYPFSKRPRWPSTILCITINIHLIQSFPHRHINPLWIKLSCIKENKNIFESMYFIYRYTYLIVQPASLLHYVYVSTT